VRITMENCGNIKIGDLQLKPGTANIKYGCPGTGKTVLAKALQAFICDDAAQKRELQPVAGQEEQLSPELFGYESLTSVACFDRLFVERFIWKPCERAGVAFELIVKSLKQVNRGVPCNIPVLIKESLEQINIVLKALEYPFRVWIDEGNGEDSPLNQVVLKRVEKIEEETGNAAPKEVSECLRLIIAFMVFRRYVVKMAPSLILIDELDMEYPKNELYVMLLAMFFWENGFKGKTTLYLTRNLYVITDCMYYLREEFVPVPYVTCMTNSGGELTEKQIIPEYINSFGGWAATHVEDAIDTFHRLIFLKRSLTYYAPHSLGWAMLRSLFNGLKIPVYHTMGAEVERPMKQEEYQNAQKELQEYIPGFDYKTELKKRRSMEKMYELYHMSGSSYEKLMIYQMIFPKNKRESIVQEYIMNIFAEEEERLLQIDPVKVNLIPLEIIECCDREMEKLKKK